MKARIGLSTGKTTRFLKLSSLSSRVGFSYFGQKVKSVFSGPEEMAASLSRAHVRNAERMARTFGELKGAVMKLGQMASLQFDFLPPEMARILSSLQKDAPPVEFSTLRGVIDSELSPAQRKLLAEIDPVPLAAASIGQVHRARLTDGRAVAVKIQYPGIPEMVDSDLRTLRRIFRALSKVLPGAELKPFFEEIRDRLNEELDYAAEADNMDEFRRIFTGDPRFLIPDVVRELTTARVLTTELAEGRPLRELGQAGTVESLRNGIAEALIAGFLRQFAQFHLLHADPNLSNFAYRPPCTLILYDFGCVKRFPANFVSGYIQLARCVVHQDHDRIPEACAEIGIRQAGADTLNVDLLLKLFTVALEPFFHDRPFDFARRDLMREMFQFSSKNWPESFGFIVPRDQVFLNRVLAGMFGNLRLIKAHLNAHRLLLPYIADPEP
jgi:predicted unusual protein kinase regulating ubiquinone biosynthesis (AarF/ABC1/UbiB family)